MNVSADVLEVLDKAETDGNMLRLAGPAMDRQLYVRTDTVLKAAGGKWHRKQRVHLFDGDAADAIEQILLTGQVTSKKQQFGYFPTPAPVVEQLMELADIQPGMRTLEPSAGRGAIALAAAAQGALVDCVEIQADNADALTAERNPNITIVVADFLATTPQPIYDRVVMNPPFARQQDIAHVKHAWTALKPGGRLVAVMSAGITFRSGDAATFRRFLNETGGDLHEVPDGAFKESGTGVSTVIATIPAGR